MYILSILSLPSTKKLYPGFMTLNLLRKFRIYYILYMIVFIISFTILLFRNFT